MVCIGVCVDLVSLQDLDVAHMAEEESESYSDDDEECAPEGPHDAPATAAPAAKAAPALSEAVVNDGPRCERGNESEKSESPARPRSSGRGRSAFRGGKPAVRPPSAALPREGERKA